MEIPQDLITSWMKHLFQNKITYFFISIFIKFWSKKKFQLSKASTADKTIQRI